MIEVYYVDLALAALVGFLIAWLLGWRLVNRIEGEVHLAKMQLDTNAKVMGEAAAIMRRQVDELERLRAIINSKEGDHVDLQA